MKRFLVALIAGAAVFSIAFAAAAALTVNGGVIQAGSDEDLTCTEAVSVEGWGLETDDGTVNSVRFSGLEGCEAADLFVNITDGDGNVIAQGSLQPINGPNAVDDTWRVTFPAQDAEDIEDLHVFIEGPDTP